MHRLLSQLIHAPIRGFHVTDLPLWKLGYLLEERWIEEDVINALSELEYFKTAALANSDIAPSHLYLPTSFFSNASASYHESPRVYTSELLDLRERLQSTDVATFGFLICRAGHYSGYRTLPSELVIDHGDTLGLLAACDALEVINWVFLDIYTPRQHISEIDVPQQTSTGPSSGSCGIGAHNFVNVHMDPSTPIWNASQATQFRQSAIDNLLQFHDIATQRNNVGYAPSINVSIDSNIFCRILHNGLQGALQRSHRLETMDSIVIMTTTCSGHWYDLLNFLYVYAEIFPAIPPNF